ncbi:hypothetical protein ACJ73_03618 [Blastomyces percursus]|uniref:Initiation-specific alpha-1,6-mannosyltransferase n=1 Tax=Blastomyces percursus TaxID=1658174 RepID=A0A1J9Q8A2_9EURO|nr:hypothetical protein ACJ73_03618 [Blastomyces percursus]
MLPAKPKLTRRLLSACISLILICIYLSTAASPAPYVGNLSPSPHLAGGFPRKIWQTWKVHPLDFGKREIESARSWSSKNPGHRYEVLTDQNDIYYLETHFGPKGLNRPDILYVYRSLTATIIKADLLRYLVMYVEGGAYADIDVEALRPLDNFIPERFNEQEIDMIIGVEIDQPEFKNHSVLGPKSQSFCQWTFACKPRLPVMLKLVDNIIRWLNQLAKKQNVPISQIMLDFDDVISGTGPSAFTRAILEDMSYRTGRTVTWDTFHNMAESKVVGGILVLTVEAFAAGQGHSNSGSHNARTALVKHHFHASGWPNNHRRYMHPILGEVERCNWNVACVAEWDRKRAEFDALPLEEQARRIAVKQFADAFNDPARKQNAVPNSNPKPIPNHHQNP